jgi:hypothetical protein
MKKLLLFLSILCSTTVFAQLELTQDVYAADGKIIRCFTNEKVEQAALEDPSLVQKRADVQQRLEKMASRQYSDNDAAKSMPPVYTIPVVVHIIYRTNAQNISDNRVFEQIQVLNDDFRRTNSDASNVPSAFAGVVADCEIEFCLATKDPSNNSTTGITRTQTTVNSIGGTNSYYSTAAGGKTIWDPTKYLNIWVCEMGGGILGFTYTPGGAPNGADGVVIGYSYFGKTGASAPYNGGRTTTHEVGHWLNLQHVWGSGNGGCNQDDFVNDTPVQNGPNSGCPSHPSTSCSNSGDMFMNYMDYVNDNCMNSFTAGQKARMRNAIIGARPGLINSQACVTASYDAGIELVLSPNGTICSPSFVPTVTVKNHGSMTLTSVNINWRIDGGATQTQAWSGSLATGQSTNVNLPQQTVASGSHTFEAWTTLPNGNSDGDGNNDNSSSNFTIASGGLALPFFEGFEGAFPAAGWALDNPDGDITWAKTTTASKTGAASMFLDNWDYPANGELDNITLPSLDMSGSASVTMTFELAYALYSATGYSDTLRVWASDDCGVTWSTIYEKFDNNLTTVSNVVTTEFVPTSNEWRQETIDLSAYANSSDVQLRFEHVCDYENNLYIDDVNISSTPATTVNKLSNLDKVQVYPNPASERLHVKLDLVRISDIEIELVNAFGQTVARRTASNIQDELFLLNIHQLLPGFYTLNVLANGQNTSRKVLIK